MFTGLQLLVIGLFAAGYAAITVEHRFIPKHFTALLLMGVLWVFGSMTGLIKNPMEEALHHGADILGIIFFLWFAMILVEILVHLGFFDLVSNALRGLPLGTRSLMVVVWIVTFFVSAMLDNLTTALVMAQIALYMFFVLRNQILVIGGIVIAANAGGAWSPIGDVTTVMLWIAKKFTTGEIISTVFAPSVVNLLVAMLVLLFHGVQKEQKHAAKERVQLEPGAKFVIPVTLVSFLFPLIVTQFDLPPAFGLAAGLGIVGTMIYTMKVKLNSKHDTQLEVTLSDVMKKFDGDSLLFFFGILYSVAALQSMHILEIASHALMGVDPSVSRVEVVNLIIGFASAVLDNIPLVAASMNILTTDNYYLWTLLAYTAGTGGSMLLIGSAAGVVTTAVFKQMNSAVYFRYISLAAFLGYIAGYAVMVTIH